MVFYALFGFIDYCIYSLSSAFLILIFDIAGQKFFSDGVIGEFTQRVYIILGVVMLFKILISCVQYLINPDKMGDSKSGLGSIFKRVIISVLLLAFVPVIFELAYEAQDAISKAIPNLVLGENNNSVADNDNIISTGDQVAFKVLMTFVSPRNGTVPNDAVITENDLGSFLNKITDRCASVGIDFAGWFGTGKCTYNYRILISTAAGVFLVYVLVSMALDVAIRTIKLGLLQILSPISISSYIDPKTESTFNTWVKTSVTVYCDLFIRFIIIYFIIFFLQTIISADNIANLYSSIGNDSRASFVLLFMILGLLLFAKSAPQFICDMLGFKDTGSFKDMFSNKRYGMLAGGLANPLRTAAGNVKKDLKNTKGLMSNNKRLLSAIRRGAGGLGKGILSSAGGFINHDDWKGMQKRMNANRDTSSRRSAKAAIKALDRKEISDALLDRRHELNTLMYEASPRDVQAATTRYDQKLQSKRDEILKLQNDLSSGAITDEQDVGLARERISALNREVNDMESNRDRIIADDVRTMGVAKAYDKELGALKTNFSDNKNRINGIDTRLARTDISDEERTALTSERDNLVNANADLTRQIFDGYRNRDTEIKARVDKVRTLSDEIRYLEDPKNRNIKVGDTITSKLNEFIGVEGITGNAYISIADTLKNNRGSLWSGEAMTKLSQNPTILSESGGRDIFKSNINGQSYSYADISNLKLKVENGTITPAELSGFRGGAAEIKAVFTDIEKSAATEYITLAYRGQLKGGNTTVTEALKRMYADIDNANITTEEKQQLLKDFVDDPGRFLKLASDRQEKFRTKGSRMSAYNSGKKEN